MDTAIAVLVFIRPELTKQLLERIREAAPPRLYVFSDGPRSEREAELVEETRRVVREAVDWNCELNLFAATENEGIKKTAYNGYTRVFEREDRIIFLEDDILPNRDFFRFSESCLRRYAADPGVMHVNGVGFLKANGPYLHRHASNWAFATWRRVWERFDYDLVKTMGAGEVEAVLARNFRREKDRAFFRRIFEFHRKGEAEETFDQRWLFMILANNGYSVSPPVNLIVNQGIGHPDAASGRWSPRLMRLKRATERSYGCPFEDAEGVLDLRADERIMDLILHEPQSLARRAKSLMRRIAGAREVG